MYRHRAEGEIFLLTFPFIGLVRDSDCAAKWIARSQFPKHYLDGTRAVNKDFPTVIGGVSDGGHFPKCRILGHNVIWSSRKFISSMLICRNSSIGSAPSTGQ